MPFIAMNRFQVAADQARQFEDRWRHRQSRLQEVPGFLHFQLLRTDVKDGQVLYASHSTWDSREAFDAWTQSENFAQAHRGDPLPKGMVLGPPRLELFDVVNLDG